MQDDLNQLRLCLTRDLEERTLADGTRLFRHTRRAEYMALSPAQDRILRRFTGTVTVQEVLYGLLAAPPRPSIREFYDLVLHARDRGFLEDAAGSATPARAAAVPPCRWPLRWPRTVTVLTAVVLVPWGSWYLWQTTVTVPLAVAGWLGIFLAVCAVVSLGHALAASALRGCGRIVYGRPSGWHSLFPLFLIDSRDAFMAGRTCQQAVALQALVGPFAAAVVGGLVGSPLLLTAAVIGLFLLASPFGATPAHDLLHATFRNAYQLPRCTAGVLSRRMIAKLFGDAPGGQEDTYLVAYCLYALVWLGAAARVVAGLVRRQGTQAFRDLVEAPDVPTRLMAVTVLVLFAVLILAPVLYQLWLLGRNLHAWVAPRWFTAESAIRQHGGTRPGDGDIAAFLRRIFLFSSLTESDCAAVAAAMTFADVRAGTDITRSGDSGDSLFVIYRGEVDVLKESETGQVTRVAGLATGDVFGEISLLDNVPRTATVRSRTACSLLILSKPAFDRLLVASIGAAAIRTSVQVCAFLRRHDLFGTWPDSALHALARDLRVVEYAAGAVAVRENQPNDTFFLIYEGRFEVRRQGARVATLSSGEFFGEISLLAGVPATADVVAVAPSRCLCLHRTRFWDVLSRDLVTGVAIEGAMEHRTPGAPPARSAASPHPDGPAPT
jgi:CRP-like cAMP-binding protein